MNRQLLSKILPHAVSIAVFFIVSALFCLPAFQGMVLQQHDMIAVEGMIKNSYDHQTLYGNLPLWNTNMFSGMPNFQIRFDWNSPLLNFERVLSLGLPQPANFFFIASVSFYLLGLTFRLRPTIAMFSALAYAFAAYTPEIINAGHITKAFALGYAPGVFAGIKLAFDRKYWIGLALATFYGTMELNSNHPQIAYYLIIIGLLMGTVYLINWIKENDWLHIAKVIGIVLVVALISLGTAAPVLMNTNEYGKYTMRSGKTIESKDGKIVAANTKGLDFDYATMWSIRISEIVTTFMPRSFGESSSETIAADSKFVDYLTDKNIPSENAEQLASQLPRYWGGLESTVGPNYLGVICVLLAIFGFVFVKSKDRWWILASMIAGSILAFGKYFPQVNETLFNFLPLYNKFRAPSMSLVILQFVTPIMAGLFLNHLATEQIQYNKEFVKKLLFTLGGLTIVLIVIYLFNDYSSTEIDEQIKQVFGAQQIGNQSYANIVIDGLIAERKSMFLSSIIQLLLTGLLLCAGILLYIRKTITANVFFILCLVVNTGDLFAQGHKYLEKEIYVDKEEYISSNFSKNSADEFILTDKDPHFRVYNLSGDRFSETRTSYFHKSIGGYHAAKLRNYQDIIETKLSGQPNMNVLNMLDTKYFIFPAQEPSGQYQVQKNEQALGAVWLVDSLLLVNNNIEELTLVDSINPSSEAVIEKSESLKNKRFNKSEGSIILSKYRNDTIEYKSKASSEQFAVFSEIYYPKGWNAYIDGKKSEYNKVNYLLRGMYIPAGEHNISFIFEPETYKLSSTIAWWSGWALYLTIICSLLVFFFERKRYSKQS
ncbi:MAG: YfhO family protein [bacterium]